MNIPVEKSNVKTNDEKKTFIVNIYVDGKNVKFASSAMSANGAILEARKKYPQGLVWGVDRATAKDESIKTEDSISSVDKAIKACDVKYVTIEYYDNAGKKHINYKENEEEAKKWIDSGKFPQTVIYDVKINGKLYKKQIRA